MAQSRLQPLGRLLQSYDTVPVSQTARTISFSTPHTSFSESSDQARTDRRAQAMPDDHDRLAFGSIHRHCMSVDEIPDRLCIPKQAVFGGCARRIAVSSVVYRYHVAVQTHYRFQSNVLDTP